MGKGERGVSPPWSMNFGNTPVPPQLNVVFPGMATGGLGSFWSQV